jgi:hypothetical protein
MTAGMGSEQIGTPSVSDEAAPGNRRGLFLHPLTGYLKCDVRQALERIVKIAPPDAN